MDTKNKFYKKPLVNLASLILVAFIFCWPLTRARAHTINHHVENRGVSVRIFYDVDDPACYSPYEIHAPGERLPHQKGRTDKNGFVCFLPDKKGTWRIKVMGGSDHGFHATQVAIEINQALSMESFEKPLVAKYTKAFVGMGAILGIFGLWSLFIKGQRLRKKG